MSHEKLDLKTKLFLESKICYFCNEPLIFKRATIEHCKPKILGGTKKHCVLSCRECNDLRARILNDYLFIEKCQAHYMLISTKERFCKAYMKCVREICQILTDHADRLKIDKNAVLDLVEETHQKNISNLGFLRKL